MLRGNGGQSIFRVDADWEQFETLVDEGVKRFEHRIHGYCWMPNNVHLAIQVNQVPLAKIVQNVSFRYTRWFNRRAEQMGHLFQGRYKAILVDAEAYLLELIRYIHLNPVRAGLVKDPAAYPWSGHGAYLGKTSVSWLTTDWVLSQFAETLPLARRRYGKFVSQGLGTGHQQPFHQGTAQGRLLGNDTFIANALRKANQPPPTLIEPETIIAAVCRRRGLQKNTLKAADRRRHITESRAVIAYLAVETGAATLTTMGALLNRDVATLSNAVRRLRERLAEDDDLRHEVGSLEKALKSSSPDA
jgi:REP element-mobilizing transposase RayT